MNGLKILFVILGLCSASRGVDAQDALKAGLSLHEGAAFYNKKEYRKAIKQFDAAIAWDHTYAPAYYWRGVARYQLKQYQSAKKDLLKAVELGPDPAYYQWLAAVSRALGENKETERYEAYAKNPPARKKILDVIEINETYHQEGLKVFNQFQKVLGNAATKLDMRLNNAAKAHAEYVARNLFNKTITTQWHYEEKGKDGFVGKGPIEQAGAFGFQPSGEYFVGNTLTGWTSRGYADPKYLIDHIAATIYHRSMVVAPHFESIGFYRLEKKGYHLLVYFYSHKILSEKPQAMAYPGVNQNDVPVAMLPEIPDPFPEDKAVGFPITVQNFTTDQKGIPVLIEAWIKTEDGTSIPFYALTPKTRGMAGGMMKALKMVSISAKDPLEKNTGYRVYMKVKDWQENTIFDRKWRFRTTGY